MAQKRNYIDQLPNEVLCMVFDHLNLKNIKNASRTCKQWNNIIFNSGYIDRFKFGISVFTKALWKDELMTSLKNRVKRLAEHTERRYRNFGLVVTHQTVYSIVNVWNIIHPKTTTNLRQLSLHVMDGPLSEILPLFTDVIPTLPQLQLLSITDYHTTLDSSMYPNILQNDIPIIRSNSVENLTMRCMYICTIDMPQLKTFNGALSALQSPDDSSPSPLFARMKENWKSVDQSIFGRMPCLEAIQWDVPTDETLFVAIIETCPSLKKLQFSKELSLTNLSVLNHLLKLTRLRRLSFGGIVVERNFFFDFSKLPQLEELDLGYTHIIAICLLCLPKTIKSLGLHVNRSNERNVMEIIPRSLMMLQLTELRLVYYDDSPSKEILKVLPFLENLEVLVFSHCHFAPSFFLGMDAPMHRLRSLRFISCQLDEKRLGRLKKMFPNVKNPELVHCNSEGVFVPNLNFQVLLGYLAR